MSDRSGWVDLEFRYENQEKMNSFEFVAICWPYVWLCCNLLTFWKTMRVRNHKWESLITHKILKKSSRDLGFKLIFLFLCSESISKVDPTQPWCSLRAYISESIIDKDVTFWHNLDWSLWDWYLLQFGNNAVFDIDEILSILDSFFYHNFQLKGKYQILRLSSEKYRFDLSESTLF